MIMQRQLRRLGLAHDPRRTFATIDPDYVRWTQWIFLQIFDSWYDETAPRPDGGVGRARPIAELVAEYDVRVRRGDRVGRPGRGRASARAGHAPAGLRLRDARELVPGPGHGAGQRGGHRRRPLRARQLPGVPAQPAAVEHAHHGLRRPADRRPGAHRLARQGQGDAAQLDRPLLGRARPLRGPGRRPGRGVHHAARHAVRRHVRRRRPGAPAARRGAHGVARRHQGRVDRRAPHPGRRRGVLPRRDRREDRGRAPGRRRPQDGRVHRPPGREPGQRRAAARVHRGLRAHGLRHRRDHGRPRRRRARLRVRRGVRPAGRLHDRRPGGHRARCAHRRRRRDQLLERRDQPGRAGRSPTPRRRSPTG